MQIGQVAERTELSLKSIRRWDEVGLVQPSARSAGGFRLYTRPWSTRHQQRTSVAFAEPGLPRPAPAPCRRCWRR
ncbi:MerR family DNA-binding transcriptional regulator [Nocardia cyriacigeorgica]|nr:MerR family DNA-binding transcriptional regulator [Nocardia cyriacigeorgica]MBF6318397.1 MerR family DNA-binding transcriptional regulator [Nocardia cyriacigeorgica]MBF6398772.1 MerR family DNA-binding transcriptional regulator [Nocardia cyriacigeorgica]MBF6403714.1 MerR family DNA-binding transcriptional regulator [Nocardia cyriacigeorgica]MBF6533935.1 MerR family DNA-binding transcriptional regulator [Nocardia cyriacigeorgica]